MPFLGSARNWRQSRDMLDLRTEHLKLKAQESLLIDSQLASTSARPPPISGPTSDPLAVGLLIIHSPFTGKHRGKPWRRETVHGGTGCVSRCASSCWR